MDRAGAGCGQADAHLACELRMGAGHECRELFVPRLHESRVAIRTVERAHDAVDAVAGIAVDALHAPVGETSHEKITDGCGHDRSSDRCGARHMPAVSRPCAAFTTQVFKKRCASVAPVYNGGPAESLIRCVPGRTAGAALASIDGRGCSACC